jgi:hypothetical protein
VCGLSYEFLERSNVSVLKLLEDRSVSDGPLHPLLRRTVGLLPRAAVADFAAHPLQVRPPSTSGQTLNTQPALQQQLRQLKHCDWMGLGVQTELVRVAPAGLSTLLGAQLGRQFPGHHARYCALAEYTDASPQARVRAPAYSSIGL